MAPHQAHVPSQHIVVDTVPSLDLLDERIYQSLKVDVFYPDRGEIAYTIAAILDKHPRVLEEHTMPELRRARYAVEATIRDMFYPISADRVLGESAMVRRLDEAIASFNPDND